MPDASTDAGERDVVICLGVRRRKAGSVAADLVSNRVVVDPLAKGLVAIERSWGTATWGTAVVVAADIGWLRLATPVIASCGAARRVVVHVVDAPAVLIGQPWRWPAGGGGGAGRGDARVHRGGAGRRLPVECRLRRTDRGRCRRHGAARA